METFNQLVNAICKPIWDATLKEHPELLTEITYEEFVFEVQLELDNPIYPE